MKVYNVWIEVEEIDEQNDDNGNDIESFKVKQFQDIDEALDYAEALYEANKDE
jgi:hypothetical protein